MSHLPLNIIRKGCVAAAALSIVLGFTTKSSQAQTSDWVWLGGASTVPAPDLGDHGVPGIAGTQGAASPQNWPGGRAKPLGWTDTAGNFWVLGGYGASTNNAGLLDDLWMFSPAANQWTWVGGHADGSSWSGVYGTVGTASPSNMPGSRYRAATWTDKNGNLWLFGGDGLDSNGVRAYLNDLWRYSPSTNEWTWMGGVTALPNGVSGDSGVASVVGTQGVASASNWPGGRAEPLFWTDPDGKFWLFGGWGGSTNGNGLQDDLWMFDPATNQWTWVAGHADGSSWPGVYGTLSVGATTNVPGSRYRATTWSDASGNLWLYGGDGLDANGTRAYLNDLWRYSTSTNQWTWIGGASTLPSGISGDSGVPSVAGTQGVSSPNNWPGGRAEALSWRDPNGDFWLLGGYGGSTNSNGLQGDLWMFNPTTTQWTWMSGHADGSSWPGIYGASGYPDFSNMPGSRYKSPTWSDSSGNLWVFGGDGIDGNGNGAYLNDLWVYHALAIADPTFSLQAGSYTSNQTLSMSDATYGATIYYTVDGTTPTRSSQVYSAPLTIASTETLSAVAILNGYPTSPITTAHYAIAKIPVAPTLSWLSSASIVYGTALSGAQLDASASVRGSFTYTPPSGSILSAGAHVLTASFAPTDTADYTAATISTSLIVVPAATTTTVIGSSSQISAGALVSLTIQVSSSTTGPPTGSVTVCDGQTQLSTLALTNGAATYSTTSLAPGTTHSLSAVYSGDSNFVSSTSTPTNVTVEAAPFSFVPLNQSNPSQSVQPGGSATYIFQITPGAGGFPGQVIFSASGLPPGASSSFSPPSLPATSTGTQNVTFTVKVPSQRAKNGVEQKQAIQLAFAILGPLLYVSRKQRFRGLWVMMILFASLVGLCPLIGCGSSTGSGTGSSVKAQSYRVTITAASGSLQQTSTVTLNVN